MKVQNDFFAAPESEDVKLADVKKKHSMPPLPGGGMKREKTVVDKAADISENRKKEMMNVLMREQTAIALQRNKEQDRQEQMVLMISSGLSCFFFSKLLKQSRQR